METGKRLIPLIANAVLGFTSITFEVRPHHYWSIRTEIILDGPALQGTTQISPGIFDQLQRILLLAGKVADIIVVSGV